MGQTHWYVIITNPNCELKATNELRRAGLRVYLPKRTFEQVKKGAKTVRSRPAWTGYLLVRFPEALQERGCPKFAVARACQGVKDFLPWMTASGFNEPAPFPEHVVLAYMRRQRNRDYDGAMQARKEREGKRANFRVGMDVQVTAGPFASFMARIEKTHADTAWIVLNIFGRETPMRMENYTESLEPLAKSPIAA
jgi:transcription antitermination factor NusG